MHRRRAIAILAALAALLGVLSVAACWGVMQTVWELHGGFTYESESDPEFRRVEALFTAQQVLWSLAPALILSTIVVTVVALSFAAISPQSRTGSIATPVRDLDETPSVEG